MKINKTLYFIVAFLAALSGVLFANQAAIAQQLDDWQVLPQPVRLSELYFTNEHQLPPVLKVGRLQKLTFTVHNLEHQITKYRYKIIAVSGTSGDKQVLGEGALTLDHDHSQATDQVVRVPALGTRLAIKVEVEYEGVPLGEKQSRPQTQSISFWARTEGSVSIDQGETRRDA